MMNKPTDRRAGGIRALAAAWSAAILLAPPATAAGGIILEEGRPRVLVIGDSISFGYTPFVAKMLEKEAVVLHHEGNAQHTGTGLERLEQWLGDGDWDVIHFNWGLWDLCYRNPESPVQGHRDKVRGTLTTPLDRYEKNLGELVARLRKTGARLIWAHTTVVPEGEAGRFAGDDRKYNRAAARVMAKHGVPVNDLNVLSRRFPPDLFAASGNVHFTEAGYRRLAEQVARRIRDALREE